MRVLKLKVLRAARLCVLLKLLGNLTCVVRPRRRRRQVQQLGEAGAPLSIAAYDRSTC